MNIPVYMFREVIQAPTCEEAHLQNLKTYIIQSLSHKKEEVMYSIRQCCPMRNSLAMIDGIAKKGKNIDNSLSIAETDNTAAAQQPHGDIKHEVSSM